MKREHKNRQDELSGLTLYGKNQDIIPVNEENPNILQSLLTSSDVGLLVFDRDLTLVFANSAYEVLFENPRYEVLGLSIESVFARYYHPLTGNPFNIGTVLLHPSTSLETEIILTNGKRKLFHCDRFNIVDDKQCFQGLLMLFSEYQQSSSAYRSARRMTEHELDFINTVSNLRKFVEEIDRGVVIYDRDYRFFYCNKVFESMLKVSRKKLVGLTVEEVNRMICTNPLPGIRHEQLLQSNECKWTYEGNLQLNDSTSIQVRIDLVPLTGIKGDMYGLLFIISDLTEQRREEERNQLLSKFSLVGEMAATLAHEVKNPMTSIRGLAQLLKESANPELEHLYDLMIEEIDRANSLLTNFLNLAKQNHPKREEIDLVKIMNSCLALIKGELINKNIRLETRIDNNCRCTGDPYQLRQALLNLLRNACEAMSGDGCLTVETCLNGDQVNIYIRDTGPGISPSLKEKIMKPFFTTKDGGTGLGLSVSQRIIRDHGGRMIIESHEGEGTCVVIELPVDGNNRAEATELDA